MNPIVVDTDLVSFYFKGDSRVHRYLAAWAGRRLVVSFMTIAALKLWAIIRAWGKPRIAQLEWFLNRHFVVHPADEQLCASWANIVAEARAQGRKLETADAWVAATALSVGAPLATHNSKDFAGISGLAVLIP
jgi:predicted nucleic acid-binding protein